MNDTNGPNLFLRQELRVVQSGGGVVHCVYVCSGYCECLSLMRETEIALLGVVVDVRHLSQAVRLLLSEETQSVLLGLR